MRICFIKKKKNPTTSFQWWESRHKTLIYQPRSWWEIAFFLLLIYLFEQVRAIKHSLTGSLKENQTRRLKKPKSLVFVISPNTKPSKWNKKAPMKWLSGLLPAWVLFTFPAFTLASLQLSLLQRELWGEVTIFNPAVQPRGGQPDRVPFEMPPSRPFSTLFFPRLAH